MFIYLVIMVFFVLPAAALMIKKVVIPALQDQKTPKQRLEEARVRAEQAKVELEIMEQENEILRKRIELEELQRQGHEKLMRDIQNDELAKLDENRKEKNGKVRS